MRKTIVYMAVQVVKRSEDGKLIEWYDGDMRCSVMEATNDAKNNAIAFPGTPYVVVERVITEVSKVFVGEVGKKL